MTRRGFLRLVPARGYGGPDDGSYQTLGDPALAAPFFQDGRCLLIASSRPDNMLPSNSQGSAKAYFNAPGSVHHHAPGLYTAGIQGRGVLRWRLGVPALWEHFSFTRDRKYLHDADRVRRRRRRLREPVRRTSAFSHRRQFRLGLRRYGDASPKPCDVRRRPFVRILPALPQAWPQGRIQGLLQSAAFWRPPLRLSWGNIERTK